MRVVGLVRMDLVDGKAEREERSVMFRGNKDICE
jgi:hypothetical protein